MGIVAVICVIAAAGGSWWWFGRNAGAQESREPGRSGDPALFRYEIKRVFSPIPGQTAEEISGVLDEMASDGWVLDGFECMRHVVESDLRTDTLLIFRKPAQ